MDTPVQPAGGEPGVHVANTGEGAAFLTEALGAQPAQQPAPQPAAPQIPQNPQPVSGQAVAFTAPPPPPQMPPQMTPQMPPQMQPQPAPQSPPQMQPQAMQPLPPQPQVPPPPPPVDFTNRYSGQQPAPDPLAGLQEAPALAPETQVAPPQNMNEQQNHAWAAIRAQSNANRRQAEEFRGKYNQLVESTRKFQEERTTFGEQLNAKDKRITELEDEIGRMDLTRSPAFQEKYDAPIQGLCTEIAQTLEANGRSKEDAYGLAREILSSDRAQVPDLISQLPTHVQGVIMIKAEQADQLFAAREGALADWRSSAEGLAAVKERGDSLVVAQHSDKMAEAALGIIRSMPPELKPPAYQVVDPAFAADRDAQEHKFRSWVQQAPEEQKYAAMLEGFMAPKTYEMLNQVMLENRQLRQVLASRGRLAAPPVTAAPAYVPPVVQAPPRPPTVQANGYTQAPSGSLAESFVRGILPGMQ